MEVTTFDEIVEQLHIVVERESWLEAASLIKMLHPADQAKLFDSLDADEVNALVFHLEPQDMAGIVSKLEDEDAAALIEEMTTDEAIRIIDEMEPDEAADVLGDIDPEKAQEILAGLDDPEEIHPLLLHADDTAGGLMTSDFLVLRRRMTVDDAINAIRQWKPTAETIFYLFVADARGALAGVVSMRQLIMNAGYTPLLDIMNTDVRTVPAGTDKEETARLMSHYDLLALPVVDENNILVGIVTIDDVVDVLNEEAVEDIQRFGGSQPLDRAYLNTSVTTLVRKRIGWLLLLFVTGSLTGTVLNIFQADMAAMVELAFFIPLLIGTGGNAGSQTTSTIIGALASGDIGLKDGLKTLWQEFRVAIIIGIILAVVAFFRVSLLGLSPAFSLTVAVSIVAIVVWADALGSILPLVVKRFGLDPAAVSGPVMSTLVDATGLLIYFSVARLILGL